MNVKQITTAPKSPVSQYLDDIYSSWPSVGYIKRQAPLLLQLNRGMTQEEAKQAVNDWIENLKQVQA